MPVSKSNYRKGARSIFRELPDPLAFWRNQEELTEVPADFKFTGITEAGAAGVVSPALSAATGGKRVAISALGVPASPSDGTAALKSALEAAAGNYAVVIDQNIRVVGQCTVSVTAPLVIEQLSGGISRDPSDSASTGTQSILEFIAPELSSLAVTGPVTKGATTIVVSSTAGIEAGMGVRIASDRKYATRWRAPTEALGITGSITNTENTLTVSSAAGVAIHQLISITGVTGVFRVMEIAGNVLTLNKPADATVSGATVTAINEVWPASNEKQITCRVTEVIDGTTLRLSHASPLTIDGTVTAYFYPANATVSINSMECNWTTPVTLNRDCILFENIYGLSVRNPECNGSSTAAMRFRNCFDVELIDFRNDPSQWQSGLNYGAMFLGTNEVYIRCSNAYADRHALEFGGAPCWNVVIDKTTASSRIGASVDCHVIGSLTIRDSNLPCNIWAITGDIKVERTILSLDGFLTDRIVTGRSDFDWIGNWSFTDCTWRIRDRGADVSLILFGAANAPLRSLGSLKITGGRVESLDGKTLFRVLNVAQIRTAAERIGEVDIQGLSFESGPTETVRGTTSGSGDFLCPDRGVFRFMNNRTSGRITPATNTSNVGLLFKQYEAGGNRPLNPVWPGDAGYVGTVNSLHCRLWVAGNFQMPITFIFDNNLLTREWIANIGDSNTPNGRMILTRNHVMENRASAGSETRHCALAVLYENTTHNRSSGSFATGYTLSNNTAQKTRNNEYYPTD